MFHFKLQPVLNYRKLLEEKLMLECADARKRLDDERETLVKLRREMADLISQLKEKGETRLGAADVSFYLSYINYMRGEGTRQEEIIRRAGEDLEEKRTELVDAAGKRRILEIIKEKKLGEYKVELNDREQKELDEAVILRSGRGIKSEEADNYL
ncbi:MAG: flagellar export protein FliJ [Deltaproteobacteria bacterium]|nr:flagellar export protein FliJ [Deltaproteobacteria bacterium]MBW2674335.1 flagellar export protein FliJ [Deltaproteobacteria bacterium]